MQTEFPKYINADNIAQTLRAATKDRERLAAELADAGRGRLLSLGESFAFETVFSRTEHWLAFILNALRIGYRVELHFFCTADPMINVARVQARVEAGGHSVPTDKIIKRYSRAIQTAVLAKPLVDELWVYDNTEDGQSPLLVGRFVQGKLRDTAGSIPKWTLPFFLGPASVQ